MTQHNPPDCTEWHVIVVGAGPAGCATALAHAQRGARVLLLDNGSTTTGRLAGEWLHPNGAAVLGRLGLTVPPAAGEHVRGFILHRNDGRPPLLLPYPHGRQGIALPHSVLVGLLRDAAAADPNIHLAAYTRVTAADVNGVHLADGRYLTAPRLVAADGRASLLHARRRLRPATPQIISRMAGLALPVDETGFPAARHGHVLLGAPGPILIYRTDPTTVRVMLDVPRHTRPRQLIDHLRYRYLPWLPQQLRAPADAAMSAGRIAWASNAFLTRDYRCPPPWAVVGDAAGFSHPIAATGLTLALTDAVDLARSSIAAYARHRNQHTWTPERLAQALYQVLTATRPVPRTLRAGVLRLWENNPDFTTQTLLMLGAEQTGRAKFTAAVLRALATGALHPVSQRPSLPGPDTSPWPTPISKT